MLFIIYIILFIFTAHLLKKYFTIKKVITHETVIMITGAANGLGK